VLRWSPPLVRLSVAEAISAICRRASNSLALMASLPPPVGRRGRGPFCNGARAEVIATAGKSSVQRWPPPSVDASAGEPLGASYPAALLVWR
jgi:hypothetical protein